MKRYLFITKSKSTREYLPGDRYFIGQMLFNKSKNGYMEKWPKILVVKKYYKSHLGNGAMCLAVGKKRSSAYHYTNLAEAYE